MNDTSPPESNSGSPQFNKSEFEQTQPVSVAAATVSLETVDAHEIERVVLHRLQNYPGLKFTRLDVHRCNRDAVCLEGFLECNEDEVDLCEIVRGIHGITNVVNHVVMPHSQQNIPKKG